MSRYPLYRRMGGPQVRSGRVEKISPPPGFFIFYYFFIDLENPNTSTRSLTGSITRLFMGGGRRIGGKWVGWGGSRSVVVLSFHGRYRYRGSLVPGLRIGRVSVQSHLPSQGFSCPPLPSVYLPTCCRFPPSSLPMTIRYDSIPGPSSP
jgi:hypothetical protein